MGGKPKLSNRKKLLTAQMRRAWELWRDKLGVWPMVLFGDGSWYGQGLPLDDGVILGHQTVVIEHESGRIWESGAGNSSARFVNGKWKLTVGRYWKQTGPKAIDGEWIEVRPVLRGA